MNPFTSRSDSPVPDADPSESGFSAAPATEVRKFADLHRWFSTAEANSTIAYHRGFLAMDRGAGSRLGDDAGEELDHIATALMAMADAGRVHLVQRRHGACDYTYLAVAARRCGRRGSGRQARETES